MWFDDFVVETPNLLNYAKGILGAVEKRGIKMKADRNIVYDGQNYKEGEEIWDLGSFDCQEVEGNKRHYLGLSADAPTKLPKYDNLGTGSTAMCLDNGDYYIYLASTKTWYQQ